jgi:hypothetical protein
VVQAESPKRDLAPSLVQFFVHLFVLLLCVGEAVPGVNESHYLPKAKHAWDNQFAPGDFFLSSHDAHFLASSSAGSLARLVPLAAVAWIGRLISWSLLAFAWCKLANNLRLPAVLAPFAFATWLLGIQYGNWAGEWMVGGFEAKAIAYPLVLLGLASLVRQDWKWVWLWLGAAVAWHPVVGGWAGLSVGIVWLLQRDLKSRFAEQIPWLMGGACIGLIGVVPAATGLSGPDVVGNVSSAQVHVYLRLPHHMTPQLFDPLRHYAGLVSLTILVAASIAYRTLQRTASDNANVLPQTTRGLGWILACSWCAVLFCVIGLCIDGLLSVPRPDIASKLLRLYWFRWADVAVPLASSLVLWTFFGALSGRSSVTGSGMDKSDTSHWLNQLPLAAAIVLTLLGISQQLDLGTDEIIPPADRLLVESPGPHAIATNRYVDWLAVCRWIRENTPPDSLWLTPKYQQTFKWYAGRAEVFCWKDVPQDNASVIEWYDRLQNCDLPRDKNGRIRDWTRDELLELSAKYGFQWVLLDRTYQNDPPALELMYPVAEAGYYIDNRSFAVFRIPTGMLSRD